MDHIWPGTSVIGILQVWILEWVAMLFSRGSSWPRDWTYISYLSSIVRSVLYHQHHLWSPKTPSVQFSSVQSLSRVRLFATPWITARQASLSITNSQSLLRLMSIESVMPSSHLIFCRPLIPHPQSLPESGYFPMSHLFAWGGQSIWVSASASVLPMNIQDWQTYSNAWPHLNLIIRKVNGIPILKMEKLILKHQSTHITVTNF